MDTRIAKWRGDAPADFTCDTKGKLAEPLAAFFKDWIAKCDESDSGRPLLPDELLREGKLAPGLCYQGLHEIRPLVGLLPQACHACGKGPFGENLIATTVCACCCIFV